ncbi:MAG: TlpA disulfide reductase family protein [Pirellulales bacterium]
MVLHALRGGCRLAVVGCALAAFWNCPAAGAFEDSQKQADENLYLARPGLAPQELLDFIERMESKPKSIRSRPGFSEALIDAANRILAAETDQETEAAALAVKLKTLHAEGLTGNQKADEELFALALRLADDPRQELSRQARLHVWEQRVLEADDLGVEELPALLEKLRAFMSEGPLDQRYLRLASFTVRIINRLADDEAAEKAYREFGGLWAKSSDRELARYGRSIERSVKPASLVGQELEIEGVAIDGIPLDWAGYRGKVVLVDFWATWCGPCRAQLPQLRQTYEAFHQRGFEIVAISLDTDRAALEKFLTDEQIPWVNLYSDDEKANGWKHPVAARYGIRAIPATLLVGKDGKVIAQDLAPDDLARQLDKLLAE